MAPRPLRALERLWDAYLWTLLFLAVELAAVSVLARSELASASEVFLALRALGPVAAVCALPVALVAGAVMEGIARAEGARARRFVAGAAAAFGAAVGFGVAGGRHFTGPSRAAFAAGVAALVGAAAFFLAPPISRALGEMARRRRAVTVTAVAVVGALATDLANAHVLPRLYPAFHLGLAALSVLFASSLTLAYGPIGQGRERRSGRGALARALAALGIFAACAALLPSSATRVAFADNLRIVYLEHAPVLGRAVEIAAAIEPPEPLEAPLDVGPKDARGALDVRGWDILLITVDALRADRVGAYGYRRPTTPNIDALASSGVVFEAGYTATPHTSYAVTSLMTGKFMRPLLGMGVGEDSETWAEHLRRYGYKTAAFYPPAVFFIDTPRFARFAERHLGFEYQREEFVAGGERPMQVARYLDQTAGEAPVVLWVHLFEPHEPYEPNPKADFGTRESDLYDGEVAAADAAVGAIVEAVRSRRDKTIVILTADHGEEFGEHGGRYHGTTVYEEQVRVPLIVSAPGLLHARRVQAPVSLVDLLPTVLSGLKVPRPARVRGRDLSGYLTGEVAPNDPGFAFAETGDMAMLAEGTERLVCLRRAGACSLFDLASDPGQRRDLARDRPEQARALKAKLRALDGSHGRYEREGRGPDERALPEALRRGMGGDVEAAPEVAALLDDADVKVRRRAAAVLFDLRRREVTPQLRLALSREEDPEARALLALALTRLGEGAPLAYELIGGDSRALERLAALALAEAGDERGKDVLIAWWRAGFPETGAPAPADEIPFERALELLEAFGRMRDDDVIGPLLGALEDVRLRPFVARALAKIGNDAARPALARYLMKERFEPTRIALTHALLDLGGGPELREPLVSMLGLPDPLPGGVEVAKRADLVRFVGGPVRDGEAKRLRRFATSGVAVDFVVPDLVKGSVAPERSASEVRVMCRASAVGGGEIRVGRRLGLPSGPEKKAPIPSDMPSLDPDRTFTLTVPDAPQPVEVFGDLPASLGVHPGKQVTLVVYATQAVVVDTCLLVPLRDPLPAAPPARPD